MNIFKDEHHGSVTRQPVIKIDESFHRPLTGAHRRQLRRRPQCGIHRNGENGREQRHGCPGVSAEFLDAIG